MGNNDSKMTKLDVQEDYVNGSLHVCIGPMYAGKTTRLIETFEDMVNDDKKTIVLTHSSEIRYSIEKLSTHDEKHISCFKYNTIDTFIQEKNDDIVSTDAILIDEAQFFPDLFEKVLYMVNKMNKHVYVFGLDGDFQRNKFGQVLDLIPQCDTVEKLHSTCNECKEPAIFSHRMLESDEQVLVGSQDIYQPLCRKCYNSKQIH
jgi:thymidine kinase